MYNNLSKECDYMKFLKTKTYQLLIIFMIIASLVAVVGALFNIYPSTTDVLNPVIIILGTLVGIYLFKCIFKLLDKIDEKKLKKAAIIINIIFFICLVIFGITHLIIPSYDLSHIERELGLMMENGPVITNEYYFTKYTNQIPLTIFLYFVYYIGNLLTIPNLKVFATIINCLSISTCAYFTYLSIKEIKSVRHGIIGLLFFVLNPIFYMYASYFYTDTLSLTFSSIAIYLLLILSKKNKKSFIAILIITGFITAMGTEMRLVVSFVMIAAIVANILNEKLTTTLKFSAWIILGFILGLINYRVILNNFEIPKDENKAFPITHWLMMGVNESSLGRYTQSDHNYTYYEETKEDKIETNIKLIKTRLSNLGIFRLIKLWGNKIIITWSNGAYRYIDKLKIMETIRSDYELICGNNMIFILYYLQIVKSMILVIFTYLLFKELKPQNQINHIKFIYIAIFGAFLFYSIWEVQARYSMSFLPWLILLFPIGIDNIKLKNNKLIPYSFIIITIILLIINYPKYVIDKNTFYDTRVYQPKTRLEKYKNINDDQIYQSFIVEDDFNIVAISFIVEDTDDIADYQFSILNEDKEEIRTIIFSSKDIKNEVFKYFEFDTIKVDKETIYYINIKPLEEINNTIGMASYSYEPYKIYPNGNLIVNDEISSSSLTFKVEYKNKRSYTNNIIYLSICSVILAMESFIIIAMKKRK